MKETKLISILEGLGLNEKEAQIYLAALKAGPSTISDLAKLTAIKRTTCYGVLDSLLAKGIIKKEIHGIKEKLVALEPYSLSKLVEEKRSALIDALPNFEALRKLGGTESVIRYIEGIDNIKEGYLEVLDSILPGSDYLVFGNMEKWSALFKEFTKEFLNKRSKMPIKVRMLLNEGPVARHRMNEGRFGNEKTKIIKGSKEVETNLIITPNKLLMHQLNPPYIGMIIENRYFINMHIEMYETMWRGLG